MNPSLEQGFVRDVQPSYSLIDVSTRMQPQPVSSDQWERTPRTLVFVAFCVLIILVAIYWFGLPILVRAAAARVPHTALEAIGSEVLASLDRDVLKPSSLTEARRDAIATAFARLSLPLDLKDRVRLEFRRSDALGANALALPSGTVVVTDDLVALAQDDVDVVAVLAHEVGHLDGRHGVRAVIRGALVSSLVMIVVGDVSALAAAAPAALLGARYSRDLEREADAYAVSALRASGIAPTRLADMLERMEADHAGAGRERPTGAFAYLSTHPTTDERLRTLRGDRSR